MLVRAAVAALALSAMPAAAQQIVAATLEEPTDRYPHRVLGPIPEHAAMRVALSDGRDWMIRHVPGMVFEDVAPRLADVTGDGRAEVLVVESHATQGARLAVYGAVDGRVVLRGATPFIGTRFRWMGVVGAGDLTGDGGVEIALVDRPHLARVLRVWRVSEHATEMTLQEIASVPDVSNHRIGDPFIAGGIRDCGAGHEIVLASGDWTRAVGVTLTTGQVVRRDLGPLRGAGDFAPLMACER